MRNVLVTGGAGFIGCNFVRHILSEQPNVSILNLDALTYAGSPDNLSDLRNADRHHLVHGDIRDGDLVRTLFREHEIDTVVNFAAETHVDRSINETAPFLQTNVMGVFALLEAARNAWDSEDATYRFLHVSTDEVYGSLAPGDPASTEVSPYRPNSPYAASKAAADHLVRAYHQTHRLPTLITNCSNNYGPYQYPEKLIPLMILNALEGKSLPVYGDGKQVRDWIHVRDHAAGVLRVLKQGRAGATYNIGGGVQLTNIEVVNQICTILDELAPFEDRSPTGSGEGRSKQIAFVADRPGHDRRYALDTAKIQKDLGWSPQVAFDQGLRETVRWYLENGDWIEDIRSRPEYQAWLQLNYAVRETPT